MGAAKRFPELLKSIRSSLGFSSARSFYQHLSSRADLEFNYSYYMKFENGEALPSVKVVHSLVHLVPKEWEDELVLAYCQDCFPGKEQIFKKNSKSVKTVQTIGRKKFQNKGTLAPQRLLTEREIGVLSSKASIYYLFLLMSVSRAPVETSQLKELFSVSELNEAITALENIKLVYRDKTKIGGSYPEYAYPDKNSASLTKLYAKLDEYDRGRNGFFKLEKKFSSEIFRRLPKRRAELIVDHMHLVLKTMLMAEETDQSLNDQVISFSFGMSLGEIIG